VEFIYLLKGKASKDPLSEREETSKSIRPWKAVYYNSDNNSNTNTDNKPEYNNNSNTSNNTGSDNNILFDSKDNRSNNSTADKNIDRYSCLDSGYNSNRTDITIIEDIDKYYTTELNEYKQPLYQISNPAEPSEFKEAKQKYKALYYKDICL
jgi:hypothetical protein